MFNSNSYRNLPVDNSRKNKNQSVLHDKFNLSSMTSLSLGFMKKQNKWRLQMKRAETCKVNVTNNVI